jgi:hypothetical protein
VKKSLGDAQLNQPMAVEGRIKQYVRKIDPGVLGQGQKFIKYSEDTEVVEVFNTRFH